jgi:general secretion pathway protein I
MIKSRGFTLIEVLLALSVLAISLTALLKTTAQTINATNRIKEKSIKHWVEIQAITKIQLKAEQIHPNHATTKRTEAFGQTWYWRAKLKPTAIKHIQQITIDVSSSNRGPFTDPLVAFYHE